MIGFPDQKKNKPLFVGFVSTLLILSILLILSFTVTTQYLAREFNYSDLLGGHIRDGFYYPWMWIKWVSSWWTQHPELSKKALFICTASFAFSFSLFALLRVALGRRSKGIEGLHGTARWANKEEIEDAGLLYPGSNTESVYIGAYRDKGKVRYLTHDGAEHVLAIAPTRSGKGVGLVIPTLLSWTGSVLCYDIKGENWALTAGWRKEHANNLVMKFEPTSDDGTSVKFNPLEEIDLFSDRDVADTQNVAMMLVDPDGKGLDDHWAKTAYGFLVATILHVCYVKKSEGKTANLTDVGFALADPSRDITELFEEMLEFKHKNGETHTVVAQEARGMLQKADKEQSGVVSTVRSNLTLYVDPVVSRNIAKSDFKIGDLMNHAKPVSLYLVVKPKDSQRLRPLIRLMISQIIQSLTNSMEYKDGKSVVHYKHRLLMMLDEFASLKRLTAVEDSLAFMASYGIKAYLVVQDLEQVNAAYGQYEGLLGNCHVKIVYAPNKLKTAEVISKMTGTATVVKKQHTMSGSRSDLFMGKVSESFSEVSRPLLTTDEVMKLPSATKDGNEVVGGGDMLVFIAGLSPIYGTQILYFIDPVFSARAKVPAPYKGDVIPHSESSTPVRSTRVFV